MEDFDHAQVGAFAFAVVALARIVLLAADYAPLQLRRIVEQLVFIFIFFIGFEPRRVW